jgi:hypothetical protein
MQPADGRTIRLCGRDIPNPGHVCAFFNNRDAEYAALLPYFKEGVEAGDEVLNVLDGARLADHRSRLSAGGITDGHMKVASSEETYIPDGRFDMNRMVSFIETTLSSAKSHGRCVRTAGWMDWMHKHPPGTEHVMEYESRMNLLVPKYDCTFMCVYDMSQLAGNMVVDIMATHPWVILDGEIRENAFYVPPESYLKEVLPKRYRRSVA